MPTINESCVCGSTFSVSMGGAIETDAAARDWREAHRICRENSNAWIVRDYKHQMAQRYGGDGSDE